METSILHYIRYRQTITDYIAIRAVIFMLNKEPFKQQPISHLRKNNYISGFLTFFNKMALMQFQLHMFFAGPLELALNYYLN